MSWETMRDDRAQAAQAARQGRDRALGVARGARRGAVIRAGVEQLHGPLPILRRIHDGVCTAVDTVAQRATFAVPDILPDGVLRGVRYWPRAPRRGEALPVFVGEAQWVWCEPPGMTRWLYFRPAVVSAPAPQPVRRLRWPITAESVPEDVGALVVTAVVGTGFSTVGTVALIGYHTGTGQLYALNRPAAQFGYFPATAPASWTTWLARLPEWGFAAPLTSDTGTKAVVVGVLDEDASADPAAVGLLAVDAINTPVAWNDGIVTPTVVPSPLAVIVTEGAGAGGSWTGATTAEYLRPLDGPPPFIGAFLGLPIRPSAWPAMQEPLGGLLWRQPAPGVVLVTETVGLPAGTAVWPLPSAVFEGTPLNPFATTAPVTYTPTLALLPAGGAPVTVPFSPPSGFWGGGDNGVTQTPIPLWVRQAADGTWVVYALLQAGAPVGTGITANAPRQWYRGTGPLDALTWEALAAVIPATGHPDLSVLSPGQLLTVSVDGQSLVAWTMGADGDGNPHRILSDDYGATWTELPALSTLQSDAVTATFDDLLLVDIPASDPRATEQT